MPLHSAIKGILALNPIVWALGPSEQDYLCVPKFFGNCQNFLAQARRGSAVQADLREFLWVSGFRLGG